MLNFNRGNAKSGDKSALKPLPYPYAPVPPAAAPAGNLAKAPAPVHAQLPAQLPAQAPAATRLPIAGDVPVLSETMSERDACAIGPATAGSQLFVGPNIKLRGVEVSDCDVLIVEGHVEATVHSKAMHIAKPGTFKGVALIDTAEIDGEFSGELTARTKLIVHGTGRVSGTIRYGRLVVADGGALSGDVQRIDAGSGGATVSTPSASSALHPRLTPQPPG